MLRKSMVSMLLAGLVATSGAFAYAEDAKGVNAEALRLIESGENRASLQAGHGHGKGKFVRAKDTDAYKKAYDAAQKKCRLLFPKDARYATGIDYKGRETALVVQTKEAQQLFNDVSKGIYKSIEELKTDPVVLMLDGFSDACTEALGGYTYTIHTAEREKLRNAIRTEFLHNGSARWDRSGKYVYDGKVKKEYKACVVIGLPASGKSTMVDPLSHDMGMFILDNDMIKEMIPEFAATGGAAAGAVYMESSEIQKNAYSEFLTGSRKGDNLVIPTIGENAAKLMDRYVKTLENAGYDVEIKYVDADPVVSYNRVMSRAVHRGRIISSRIVLAYGNGPAETYEWFKTQKGANGKPYVREGNEAQNDVSASVSANQNRKSIVTSKYANRSYILPGTL